MVEHINHKDFDAFIKSGGKVLIDFWAPWCGPCRALAPVLDSLSEKRSDIKIGKVNVDENQELALSFGVRSIPALFLFEKGTLLDETGGYKTLEALEEFIGE